MQYAPEHIALSDAPQSGAGDVGFAELFEHLGPELADKAAADRD